MTSPPPSPPNAVPKNPWNRNSAAAAAVAASVTTLAGEWPPLKASQIPAAESQAELQAEAEMSQTLDPSAVGPVAAAAAPDSSSAPPPPPPSPVSTNRSRNHSPNHSNHRRGGQNQWRNHQHQGNRYPPWNPNPNPNVGFNRLPPPSAWSSPLHPHQWASFPSPPLPFYPNGYIDPNPRQFVYNAILPTAHSYFPVAPSFPFPSGQAMPQLMIDIRKQIEYYFSEGNLITDKFLKRQMDKEFGWVDLKLIAGFRKVAALTEDLQIVKGALVSSDVVQLEGDKIRRKNDWRRWILEEK